MNRRFAKIAESCRPYCELFCLLQRFVDRVWFRTWLLYDSTLHCCTNTNVLNVRSSMLSFLQKIGVLSISTYLGCTYAIFRKIVTFWSQKKRHNLSRYVRSNSWNLVALLSICHRERGHDLQSGLLSKFHLSSRTETSANFRHCIHFCALNGAATQLKNRFSLQ